MNFEMSCPVDYWQSIIAEHEKRNKMPETQQEVRGKSTNLNETSKFWPSTLEITGSGFKFGSNIHQQLHIRLASYNSDNNHKYQHLIR